MIMHIVMWKFKEENKQENMDKFQSMLMDLKGVIPQIKHIEVGQDINQVDTNYDIVLVSEFKNTDDLMEYQVHPEHQKVSEYCNSIRIQRVCVDYEI